MTRRISVLLSLLVLALLVVGVLFAQQRPADDISPKLHPNLAAAQKLCNESYDKLVIAQGANDFDMEGHAKKAKQLLVEASHEMKAAAMAINKEKKK
jgi:hypothetical protein